MPPTELPGVGVFQVDGEYGIRARDVAVLPDGLQLKSDDWDEPYLSTDDGAKLKDLWLTCARAWRDVVEGK